MLSFFRSFIGKSGLYRNSLHANKLIDDEIISSIGSISGMIKESGLSEEIEKERLKISKELDEFLLSYHNGSINSDIANSMSDKILEKYKALEIKVDELNDIRQSIKNYDSISKEKEIELEQEMKKHKKRTIYELEKGYY